MIALNYNELVTIRDVTSLKSAHGIWSVSGPTLTLAGQLTSLSSSQWCFHLMIRSDNIAPFLSIYEMHNAAYRPGVGHSSKRWPERENFPDRRRQRVQLAAFNR